MTNDNLTKDELVKKEVNKIRRSLKEMNPELKKINEKLIYNAAWLAVSLDDLTKTMDECGVVAEYKNGENQYGTKKSPEAELYTSWSKQYATIMKQLSDLLPKDGAGNKKDELMQFLTEGARR
ncbi:hypothetical protein BTO30_12415 [Domibacillus antri]|uniref:Terminase n=1 Tax=Domibacillus antri TaxID=1714264 RepID=A0A1Q8Q3M4_9BACI|nr:hypothetical protein [Domibacillus antri]OLN21895.1 hypothetical protein BTO30_12415 [Domibacillus antri]